MTRTRCPHHSRRNDRPVCSRAMNRLHTTLLSIFTALTALQKEDTPRQLYSQREWVYGYTPDAWCAVFRTTLHATNDSNRCDVYRTTSYEYDICLIIKCRETVEISECDAGFTRQTWPKSPCGAYCSFSGNDTGKERVLARIPLVSPSDTEAAASCLPCSNSHHSFTRCRPQVG